MPFPPNSLLHEGQLFNQYEITAFLGRGGMGEVYRGSAGGSAVAIKVLRPEALAGRPDYMKRFLDEGRLACRIKHPSVVAVLDARIDGDLCSLVMEYIDGGTVQQMIDRGDRIDWEWGLVIALRISEALESAAQLGIVHRDIKPDNIMLTASGEVKLADLGIAKCAHDEGVEGSPKLVGTPAYASPEQCVDSSRVDARSDIYSLGATLFEILTGRLPYPGRTAREIVRQTLNAPIPDPRTINSEIPEPVARLVMQMLAKQPEERPQSAAELSRELQNLIFGRKAPPKAKVSFADRLKKIEAGWSALFPTEREVKLGKIAAWLAAILIAIPLIPLPAWKAKELQGEDPNPALQLELERDSATLAETIAKQREELAKLEANAKTSASRRLLDALFDRFDAETAAAWFAAGARVTPGELSAAWLRLPRYGFLPPKPEYLAVAGALLDRNEVRFAPEDLECVIRAAAAADSGVRTFAASTLSILLASETNRKAFVNPNAILADEAARRTPEEFEYDPRLQSDLDQLTRLFPK